MKSIKRLVAITLSFVVIMTGIYWSEAPAKDVQAATTAEENTDMLNVKVQVATNGTNVMRFVSSVDSLNYKSVGFEITPEGEGKTTHPIDTVFKRIDSSTEGVEYTYSPKVVDTSAEYFMTAKWHATEGVDVTVRAFAVLPNGNTIYGTSRCVALEDGRSTTTHLNMSFQADNASELENVEEITNVTYAAANNTDETKIKTTTAEVIDVDGNTVHVRVQNVKGKELASVTNFTFGEYGSGEFRNLLSEYDGSTGDTSWYNDTDTEFIIASSADLYGMASLANNKSKTFKDQTIYVVSDIAVNSTTEGETAKEWADATTELSGVHKWTRITKLEGTFDGQMHTISGIYMNASKITGTGLFGTIAGTGKVCNLYIKESLFKSDYADLGSVAGFSEGTISTVFSNAYVIPTYQRTGGIVGNMKKTSSVDNCWFDGEMRLPAGYAEAGGIVGKIAQDTTNTNASITDCLYTGKITFGKTSTNWAVRIGGIVGGAHDSYTPIITLQNCVSAGTVRHKDESQNIYGVSSVYGGFDEYRLTTLNLENVYGITGYCTIDRIYHQYKATGSGITDTTKAPMITGTGTLRTEAELQGSNGYQNTLLDFEDTWVARNNDVPALKAFTDEIGEKADLTGVEQDGWYNATETVFGIPSASALKKISEVSETDNFKDKYVYLTNDVDLNPGWTAPKDATTAVTNNPENFVPIANTKAFAGTFDGREHTIRGIYCTESSVNGTGLFGEIAATSTVQNVAIRNSYFKQTGNKVWAASVAGYSAGTIKNIYSEAKVITDGAQSGGIAGRAEGTIDNCWFNGNIYSTKTTSANLRMGGIVGCSYSGLLSNGKAQRPIEITNCLNTGSINYNVASPNTKVGTAIGGIWGTDVNGYTDLTMSNCVSTGTMNVNNTNATGAIVSMISQKTNATISEVTADYYSTAKITNCYGAKDCIPEYTGAKVVHWSDGNCDVTWPGSAALLTSELKGDAIYYNESIQLDYSKWIARANESPIPRVFIDWIIPASDTVEAPTN